MKVLHSELDYTGGGIWCAWGELEDGTIFMGSDNQGFSIHDKAVLDHVVVSDNIWEEVSIYDLWDEELIRYTDDDDSETFEIWMQIYEQHDECTDRMILIDELMEIHKDKEEDSSMFYILCDGDPMTAVRTLTEAYWLVREYKKEDNRDGIRHKYTIEEADYNNDIINDYQER